MGSTYWDGIYSKKEENEVSWYQENASSSLSLIAEFKIPYDAPIIDVGAGESRLVDSLLGLGFKDVTLLDISSTSLDKTKSRLGEKSHLIQTITSDVTVFKAPREYFLWHDRATFHFLTEQEQVIKYLEVVRNSISNDGFLIISTFSQNGPDKCSGLPIKQYSDQNLKDLFGKYFKNIKCFDEVHKTPWGSEQAFVYCGFQKLDMNRVE